MPETNENDQSTGKKRRRKVKPGEPIPMPAWLFFPLSIGTMAAAMMLYRRGDTVSAMTVITISLFGWIGFRMGLGRIIATVLALVAAISFAPSLGMQFELRFSNQFGTTGLTNRFLCIAAIGVSISMLVTILASVISNRFLAKRQKLNLANSFVGFAIGLIEGAAIAWLVLGGLLSMQMWQRGFDIDNNPVAQSVDQWASATRQSMLGPTVRDNNPFEKIEQLSQIGDLQQTVRRFSDPQSLQRLLDDPKIAELRSDPAIAAALDEVRRDPAVNNVIQQNGQLDREALMRVMSSPSVMRLVDQPEFRERARAIIVEMN